MRGPLLLLLGVAAVACIYRGKRTEARTEADDDASLWHFDAEAGTECLVLRCNTSWAVIRPGEGTPYTH